MGILKIALLAALRIAFMASLKIALLVYIFFLLGAASPREPKRKGAPHMLRRHPGQFKRGFQRGETSALGL